VLLTFDTSTASGFCSSHLPTGAGVGATLDGNTLGINANNTGHSMKVTAGASTDAFTPLNDVLSPLVVRPGAHTLDVSTSSPASDCDGSTFTVDAFIVTYSG
jgi:hypothetical protein